MLDLIILIKMYVKANNKKIFKICEKKPKQILKYLKLIYSISYIFSKIIYKC